jgi:hypothetical protein
MSASLSELEAQRDRLKRQLSDVGNLRLEVWWSVTASAANRIAIALSLTVRAMARRGRSLTTCASTPRNISACAFSRANLVEVNETIGNRTATLRRPCKWHALVRSEST